MSDHPWDAWMLLVLRYKCRKTRPEISEKPACILDCVKCLDSALDPSGKSYSTPLSPILAVTATVTLLPWA